MMKYTGLIFLSLSFLIISCSNKKKISTNHPKSYQAISAQGDTLYAPDLDEQTQKQYEADLKDAQETYNTYPDSAEVLINYAQRTGDLGEYREAINIYGEGIKNHVRDARLYQQRGRQYIITRQFSKAVSDLQKAARLIEESQPDSLLQTDTWFNLGIAQYLQGNYNEADSSFQRSLDAAHRDEMRVKVSYWLYMSMRRAGMDLQAGKVLEPIKADIDLKENENYLKLLLVFKGDFDEKSLLNDSQTPLDNATIGYGLGNWHYINGREKRAKELFQKVYHDSPWNLIGHIAAETDLHRLFNERSK